MQGFLILAVALTLAVLVPTLEHVTILRHDRNVSLAFTAATWACVAVSALVGMVAYAVMSPALLLIHAALTAISGAAATVAFMLIYLYADLRCATAQAALLGCDGCACAAASACNAVRFGDRTCDESFWSGGSCVWQRSRCRCRVRCVALSQQRGARCMRDAPASRLRAWGCVSAERRRQRRAQRSVPDLRNMGQGHV